VWRDDPRIRLLTATEAARRVGVATATIRDWDRRGRIIPRAKHGRLLLYLESDVLRADAEARRNPGPKRTRHVALDD
jgi:predicted site-specific integrase-resolvase